MARWLVQLDGERMDLEEFPQRFPNGNLYAIEKDGLFYLTGPEFESLSTAQEVRDHATVAVEEMSGIVSLLWSGLKKPTVGSTVYRENDQGGRSTTMFAVTGVLRMKGSVATLTVSGTKASAAVGPTAAQRLLAAARADDHLRTALYLWASHEPNWWLLYRIVEEIEAHLGGSVSSRGYCSKNERERFRWSANSAEASGLGARHAGGTFQPPTNPMTLADAKALVRRLFEQVLGQR